MTDCETAQTALRRAKEWRDGRTAWVGEKKTALITATQAVATAKTAWDSAVASSVQADAAIAPLQAARNTAFQEMVDAETAYNNSSGGAGDNTAAVFKGKQEEFEKAKNALADGQTHADELTAFATAAAGDHEDALTAQTTCETELELANGEVTAADKDITTAEAEVTRACG